jgi:hypothetical protein
MPLDAESRLLLVLLLIADGDDDNTAVAAVECLGVEVADVWAA